MLLALIAHGALGLAPQSRQLQLRGHAGEQLARAEGLDQIFIGAGLQTLDAGLLARTRRQQNHRHRARSLVAADGGQQSEAVQGWHHHVREDQIRRILADPVEGGVSVGDDLDAIVPAENPREVVPHVRIVIGNQDARGCLRCAIGSRCCRRRDIRRTRRSVGVRQPSQCFLDVRRCAGARRHGLAPGRDAFCGKVSRASAYAHREGRAAPFLARDDDSPSMQADQFLYQRETDTGAFVRPRPRMSDPMKPFEHAAEVCLANADAGVDDAQFHVIVLRSQLHSYFAFERELEGIAQEIEDDLFPHVPIDIQVVGKLRTIDHEFQAGPFDRRTEDAGQVGRECRQVGRLVAGLHAPRLDSREVEKGVDELRQTKTVPLRDLQPFLIARVQFGLGQHILHGPEHQCQWRPKLMTDIGEERRLGSIDLCQGLDATPFLLQRFRIGDARRDLRGEKSEECRVILVERPHRTDTGDDGGAWAFLAGEQDRQDDRGVRRNLPGARRQPVHESG